MSHDTINQPFYCFEKEIDVRSLYARFLLEETVSLDALEQISRNFVLEGQPLLKSRRKPTLRHHSSVCYREDLQAYCASKTGFVHYETDSLEVFSYMAVEATKMYCYGFAPRVQKVDALVSSQTLEKTLRSLKIRVPYEEEGIANFLSAYRSHLGGRFILAKGRPAIEGKPMVVAPFKKWLDSEGESEVLRGEKIATYQKATQGMDGLNLYKEVIRLSSSSRSSYSIGMGLDVDEAKKEVTAEVDGILEISSEKVLNVCRQEVIQGDLQMDLISTSSVLIRGNVLKGVTLRSEGSVRIFGNVERASLRTALNLTIYGGALGSEESILESAGTIKAGHITTYRVECKGDLRVKNYLVDSEVQCQGRVFVENLKKGKIIGGSIYALKGITCAIVGNPNGTKTCLSSGKNQGPKSKIKSLEVRLKENSRTIMRLKDSIGRRYFNDPTQYLSDHAKNTHKILMLKKNLLALKEALGEREELQALSEQKEDVFSSDIRISKRMYEGTILSIHGFSKTIQKEIAYPTLFFYDKEKKDLFSELLKDDDTELASFSSPS